MTCRLQQRLCISILACLALLCPYAVRAQSTSGIDIVRLQDLYAQYVEQPASTFLERRIQEEQASIRQQIEEEISRFVDDVSQGDDIDIEITKSVDRQRSIINALTQRLQDRKVDLDLLLKEETLYTDTSASGSVAASDEGFRLTKTHAELLARKAVFEERIDVLQRFLVLQQERLKRLQLEQKQQQVELLYTVGQYLLIILAIWLIERTIRTRVLTRIRQRDRRYTTIKLFSTAVYGLLTAWLLAEIFASQPGILASLAIVGAGLAISLQDVVKDMIGWVVIHQASLYTKGDRITLGQDTGEVIDIGLLHTTLMEIGLPPHGVLEQTGKVLCIPNARVLTSELTNYNSTSDFVKAEMRITITFESNFEKAETLLNEILQENTEQYADVEQGQYNVRTRMLFIPHDPGHALIFTDIAADGVEFTLRFTVPIGERRGVVSRVAKTILTRFNKEPDIDLAYTTQRIIGEVSQR